MAKPFTPELSQRLDQVITAVESLQEVRPSEAQEKALAKWEANKRKLEKAVFDD